MSPFTPTGYENEQPWRDVVEDIFNDDLDCCDAMDELSEALWKRWNLAAEIFAGGASSGPVVPPDFIDYNTGQPTDGLGRTLSDLCQPDEDECRSEEMHPSTSAGLAGASGSVYFSGRRPRIVYRPAPVQAGPSNLEIFIEGLLRVPKRAGRVGGVIYIFLCPPEMFDPQYNPNFGGHHNLGPKTQA